MNRLTPIAEKAGVRRVKSARTEASPDRGFGPRSALDQIIRLQRTFGNRGAGRLLRAGVGRVKFTVGDPDESCGEETDRVAEPVRSFRGPQSVLPCTGDRIQRIPKNPEGVPFEGVIVPWSAALHESAGRSARVLADLPRNHPVTVKGGRAWILVETVVDGKKLTGYVSHELIRKVISLKETTDSAVKTAETTEKARESAEKPHDTARDTAAETQPPVTESPKLTRLKELLEQNDVPENDVINLMRILTPAEASAVASSNVYQELAVAAFDDDEMIQALNAMRLSGKLRHDWMAAEGIKVFQVVSGKDYIETADGASVNPELKKRAGELCQYLIDNNLVTQNVELSEGARSARTAHKWSTAYYIRKSVITEDLLKALPGGKDADGNLWWKQGWSQAEIIANANSLWSGDRANEGYPPGDPRRRPNTDDVEMSQHCPGQAIDIRIRWRNGDGWHAEANDLVKKFGLSRPEAGEAWHFELEGGRK